MGEDRHGRIRRDRDAHVVGEVEAHALPGLLLQEGGGELDEAVADCVVDVAGRPYVVCKGEPDGQVYALIGGSGVPYAGSMTYHVVEALALNAGLCVHLTLLAGRDPHHIVEAQFKALARALREAVEIDPRVTGVPSTKGSL